MHLNITTIYRNIEKNMETKILTTPEVVPRISSPRPRFQIIRLSVGAGLIMAGCQTTKPAPVSYPSKPTPAVNSQPATKEVSIASLPPAIPTTPYQPACDVDVPNNRPNWEVLWQHFPKLKTPKEVFDMVGGKVAINGNLPKDQGRWENACVVRLNYSLHKAGIHPWPVRKKTVSGQNNEQYYYRVADFKQYIEKIWGPPDITLQNSINYREKIGSQPSLIIMDYNYNDGGASGHVTLWDGLDTVDPADVGGTIEVWHLPCANIQDKDPSPPASDQDKFD